METKVRTKDRRDKKKRKTEGKNKEDGADEGLFCKSLA